MKKIFALGLTLVAGSAFAQDTGGSRSVATAAEGMRHMFEFNLDSVESAAISFDKIKTKGQDTDNGTNLDLSLNYAYGVTSQIQAAARFDYFSGVNTSEDEENFGLAVGAIYNFSEDFLSALYVSAYLGVGFAQQFGDNASRDDLRSGTFSFGRRFPLDMFGVKHVVYSPEVSMKFVNSTTDESLDYSNSLQFKVLQFSVFF
jgi:hypothetical protein